MNSSTKFTSCFSDSLTESKSPTFTITQTTLNTVSQNLKQLKLRCRQFKLRVNFFTPFDRVRAADHENLLFSLSKYFLPIEKDEILERYHFSRKIQKFLLRSFFQLLRIIFSDSASKTEQKLVIKSTIHPKFYWWWRFAYRRVH